MEGRRLNAGSKVIDRGKRTESKRGDGVKAKSRSFRWSKMDVEGRGFNAGSKVIDRGKRLESKRGDGVQVKLQSFR